VRYVRPNDELKQAPEALLKGDIRSLNPDLNSWQPLGGDAVTMRSHASAIEATIQANKTSSLTFSPRTEPRSPTANTTPWDCDLDAIEELTQWSGDEAEDFSKAKSVLQIFPSHRTVARCFAPDFIDTSPLQVFVQMCTMGTVCAHGELLE
jgi:hypothetical protein